jgi:ERCC4-related helicase
MFEKFLKEIKPREYQKRIFETCKEKNCLVVLPTGLGKTLIALMLAVERLNKFPEEKIVFLSPTKPLAEQHINYFKKNLPELFADMQLFTGLVKAQKRKEIWQTADIIFSTPQCIANDIRKNLYNLSNVSLLIEDEAHRCIKNYDYNFFFREFV